MTSAIEAEILRVTGIKAKPNEPRQEYLNRLLEGGQRLKLPTWEALSMPTQQWYNDCIVAWNKQHKEGLTPEIPDFPGEDIPTDELEESTTILEEVEAAAADESEEHVSTLEQIERDQATYLAAAPAEPEPEPVRAAPTRKPPPKVAPQPVPKPAPKPKPRTEPAKAPIPEPAAAKPRTNGPTHEPEVRAAKAAATVEKMARAAGVKRPPPPTVAGATTMIKRLLLENLQMTNVELVERLKAEGAVLSNVSVASTRSEFKHSIRVLQEAGYCQDLDL